MSSEKRGQAIPACKEEGQVGSSGVSIATADARTDRLSARPTEDGGSNFIAMGEKLERERFETTGSDATPDFEPDLTALRSQIQLTHGQNQQYQDRVQAFNQEEAVPNGTVVLDGAVSQTQQGPSQNKTTSIGPRVGRQASYAVTAFPTDVHHVPSERSYSAPPMSKTRYVPSAVLQGDSRQPEFDDVRRSSWPSCKNQPKWNAWVDDTCDPADDAPDGIEAHTYSDDLWYIPPCVQSISTGFWKPARSRNVHIA